MKYPHSKPVNGDNRMASRLGKKISPTMIVLIASLAIAVIAVYASDSVTVNYTTTQQVTGPDGICKKITNNSGTGLSEYVPTTSTAEWQSFVANPPAGVTLASCVTDPTGPIVIFLTSGTTWTVPADWNNANNSIEAIGAGGGGGIWPLLGGGGGGGAYAKIVNLTLTPGSNIPIQIGVGGGTTGSGTAPTANTWLENGATIVAAGGVSSGVSSPGWVGGAGGSVANSVGTTKFAGGNGGNSDIGGGGGGAGGNTGAGGNPVSPGPGGAGGPTGGGAGGADGGSDGAAGTNFDATHGAGGGGGGPNAYTGSGNGGLYGAGGSGADNLQTNPGLGAPGIIVITYTPI